MVRQAGHGTEFEIRHELRRGDTGFWIFSIASWWAAGAERPTRAGGLTRDIPFASEEAAIAWVEEQFSLRRAAWQRRADGVLVASQGDSFD
jgi:hypothetical protein